MCELFNAVLKELLNEAKSPIAKSNEAIPLYTKTIKDDQIKIRNMTEAQATAFMLLKQFMEDLLPPNISEDLEDFFKNAKTRLSTITTKKNWLDKTRYYSASQPLIPPKIDTEIRAKIYKALWNERCIKATYHKKDKTVRQYEKLHLLGLYQRGPITYLIVKDENSAKDSPLQLALHRFDQIEILEDEKSNSKNFKIEEYLDAEGNAGFATSKEKIRLEVIFDSNAAAHLYETKLADTQVLVDMGNGKTKLNVTLPKTQQLVWWLRAFGSAVEVVEPDDLREEFKKMSEEMAKLYK